MVIAKEPGYPLPGYLVYLVNIKAALPPPGGATIVVKLWVNPELICSSGLLFVPFLLTFFFNKR